MYGACIGNMVGFKCEFNKAKRKSFPRGAAAATTSSRSALRGADADLIFGIVLEIRSDHESKQENKRPPA